MSPREEKDTVVSVTASEDDGFRVDSEFKSACAARWRRRGGGRGGPVGPASRARTSGFWSQDSGTLPLGGDNSQLRLSRGVSLPSGPGGSGVGSGF
jgi:hypothetical protein